MKENISTGQVAPFPQKHSNWICSLFLSEDQQTLFSGCDNGDLKQHSLHTLKSIQGIRDLGIGALTGIDMKKNLLVVGGEKKFCLLRFARKCGKDLNVYIIYIE